MSEEKDARSQEDGHEKQECVDPYQPIMNQPMPSKEFKQNWTDVSEQSRGLVEKNEQIKSLESRLKEAEKEVNDRCRQSEIDLRDALAKLKEAEKNYTSLEKYTKSLVDRLANSWE